MDGHVGVYIGGGYVIEAKGFSVGVVKTSLKSRPWKRWGKCPYITYETKAATKKPTANKTTASKKAENFLPARGYFKKGDVSENVGKIATFMRKTFPSYTSEKALGNTYGDNIIKAVKEFQKRTGLEPDGYFGKLTLAELKKHGFKE
jgi:murein L,D-transpeptidase YcbB/YkuD